MATCSNEVFRSEATYVGRFAPSPTGRMHLGNVYTAFASYLRARQAGGRWILRMEDIDPQRSRPEYALWIQDDLTWLGLEWDALYVQSERFALYQQALDRLSPHTYPLFRSRRERLAVGAPQQNDLPVPMPTALPATAIRVGDEDVILRRSDGAWAYHLAVVVDDAEMGVTEVVRGDDLACCVPVHHRLQDLLGYPHPAYFHIPLLYNEAGQRLSKRDRAMDMSVLRTQYTPSELRSLLTDRLTRNGILPCS